MKVLTWNILSSMWLYPDEDYQGIDNYDLDFNNRLVRIVDRINYHNPDIVLLQEVSTAEYKKLKKALEDNYLIPKLIQHGRSHWKNYLYKGHKYQPNGNLIIIKRDSELTTNKDRKPFVMHSIKLSKDGNVAGVLLVKHLGLIVVSVHLDDLSKLKRNNEIRTLFNFLEPYREDHIIVIGGDFNAEYQEYLHNLIRKAGFKTGQAPLKKNAVSYAFEPRGLIDYIYVMGGKIKSYMVDDRLIDRMNNVENNKETIQKYGSDHYPVIAEINL
jgi:endonuclease/exonuclease/phosphatase family metal-dependent hydrolase